MRSRLAGSETVNNLLVQVISALAAFCSTPGVQYSALHASNVHRAREQIRNDIAAAENGDSYKHIYDCLFQRLTQRVWWHVYLARDSTGATPRTTFRAPAGLSGLSGALLVPPFVFVSLSYGNQVMLPASVSLSKRRMA